VLKDQLTEVLKLKDQLAGVLKAAGRSAKGSAGKNVRGSAGRSSKVCWQEC
jgi:hypothetical protein